MTRFSIQSFGCRVNQAEAFDWVSKLQDRGLTYVEEAAESDLILINTCTLTARADRDVRSYIRRVLRENRTVRLVITGCYAERTWDGLFDHPRVWRVFSNAKKHELAEAVSGHFGSAGQEPGGEYRSRAPVKIQDGCDLGCSFCVIPSVRGPSRSEPISKIEDRVRILVGKGFSEVVLTGVHIALYGRDLGLKEGLLDLVKSLEKIEGLWKIRLSSLDPRFVSGAFLGHITASGKVCPHFHLSLQSGSDAVLKKMGRGNRAALYRRIIRRLRDGSPDAAMGADIIVGFPGETENRFEETRAFLEESPLTYFHVFSYSPRTGTPAAGWEPVDEKEKKRRSACLRAVSARKNLAFRQRFVGRVTEGVVVKREEAGARVLTPNYIDVRVDSKAVRPGRPVLLKITKAVQSNTRGELLRELFPNDRGD